MTFDNNFVRLNTIIYLIDGDLSIKVISNAGQTEASQIHWVLRQLLGDGEGVYVFEFGKPVHDSLELPHWVALLSKNLDQQDFGLHIGRDTWKHNRFEMKSGRYCWIGGKCRNLPDNLSKLLLLLPHSVCSFISRFL